MESLTKELLSVLNGLRSESLILSTPVIGRRLTLARLFEGLWLIESNLDCDKATTRSLFLFSFNFMRSPAWVSAFELWAV